MNSEESKNYSEAIKNIVVSISVIIAGCWAYLSFNERLEAETARAKLEKINYELKEKPNVNGALEYCSQYNSKNGTWIIKIEMHFTNDGNTNLILKIDQESIRVSKVIMKNGMISGYSNSKYTGMISAPPKSIKGAYLVAKKLEMNAKSKASINSVVEVMKSGVYEISFHAKLVKIASELVDEVDLGPFSALEYIVISDQSNEKPYACEA